MAGLTVEFEKRKDGDSVLRCIRADGSTTWQHHAGPRGVFFAYHDLTHLAVERTLGLRTGFFGLIASGWEIAETEGKSARGPLPPGTVEVENLVGLFDRERGSLAEWSADEFNTAASSYAAHHGHAAPAALSDDEVIRVRAAIRELQDAWRNTAPGSTLGVEFGPGAPPARPSASPPAAPAVSASSPGSSRGR